MSDRPSIVAENLRVHGEFHADELEQLVDHWAKLDHRLEAFERRSVKLDLHVHDRDTAGQWVLLEAHIGGCAPIVAKHASRSMDDCLNHVRDELVRQLSDAKGRMEPRPRYHGHHSAVRA
jgi:hydrogenase maturation factor